VSPHREQRRDTENREYLAEGIRILAGFTGTGRENEHEIAALVCGRGKVPGGEPFPAGLS